MIYSLNLYKPLNYERRKYLNKNTTNTVPIWEKSNLTLAEAADYSGVKTATLLLSAISCYAQKS